MTQSQINDAAATLPGATGAEGSDEINTDRQLTPREMAMQEIEAANLRRLQEETGVQLVDDTPPTDNGSKDAQDQLEAQLNADEPQVLTPSADVKVKVKVDGEELEVPLADVVRNFQKDSAADKRLNEATRLLREAEARAQQTAAAAPPAADPAPATAQVEPGADVQELEQKVKTAFSKLYEGDEDGAAAELVQLIAGRQAGASATQAAPQIDIDQLTDQLQRRLAESNAVQTAMDTIQKDYPEVISNPDFELLAAFKANGKMANGMSHAQAIVESAQEVYESLGLKAKGRQQEDTRGDKLKRKQQLDDIRPANATVPSTQEPTEESSPSKLIQEMAAKRLGQTVNLVRG